MKFSEKQFQVKFLSRKDLLLFKKLVELFHEVFEMDYPISITESRLQTLLGKKEFVALVVINNNEVVGGLTAYELQGYYSDASELFIYDLGIKPDFQRKGLAGKLISHLKEYGRKKGIKNIFVAAHEEDQHALEFYRSTGGKAEKVVHFTYEPDSDFG